MKALAAIVLLNCLEDRKQVLHGKSAKKEKDEERRLD